MLTETSELIGLEIYTDRGALLGAVEDLVYDLDKENVYGMYIEKSNPLLVEDSIPIVVPFRWIEGVGDIIVLHYFPGFINSDGSPEHMPFMKRVSKQIERVEHDVEDSIHDIENKFSPKKNDEEGEDHPE